MYLARNAVIGRLLFRPRLHRSRSSLESRESRLSGLRADLENGATPVATAPALDSTTPRLTLTVKVTRRRACREKF